MTRIDLGLDYNALHKIHRPMRERLFLCSIHRHRNHDHFFGGGGGGRGLLVTALHPVLSVPSPI